MSTDDSFFTIKFVEMVEKYPCLYDSAHPDHRKRDITEKVWKEISSKMKDSVAHCKEKWKNLRTAFARSIKQPPPGSSGPKKARDYYLKDVMQFVLPYMKTKSQNDSLPQADDDDLEVLEETNDITNSTIWNDNDVSQRNVSPQRKRRKKRSHPLDIPVPNPYIPSFAEYHETEQSDTSAKKQRTSTNTTNEVDQGFIEYTKPQQTSMRQDSSNPDRGFLESLLPDIAKMSDYQKRQFKRRTLDVIDSILCDGPPQSPARSTVSSAPRFVVIDSQEEDNKNLIDIQPNFIRKFSSP